MAWIRRSETSICRAGLWAGALFMAILAVEIGPASGGAKPYEGVTLRGMLVASSRMDPLFGPYTGPPLGYPLVKDFENMTGVRIETVRIPFANMTERQLLELTNPDGYYDFHGVERSFLARYAQYLEPLTNYLRDPKFPDVDLGDFTKTGLGLGEYGGVVYGLPFFLSGQIMAYRKDLLAEQNLKPPESWADVLRIAKALTVDTNKDGKIDRYGFTFTGHKSEIHWIGITFLYAWGARLFDEKNRPVFNTPEAVKAMEALVALAPYTPPGALGNRHDECNLEVAQDRAAMYLNFSFAIKQLRERMLSDEMKPKLGFVAMPSGTRPSSVVTGWSFAIPKNAKRKEAAYHFINWLTGSATMKHYNLALTPAPPLRSSVLGDAAVLKVNPEFEALAKTLRNANVLPSLAEWLEVSEVFQTGFTMIFSGKQAPAAGLRQMEKEIDAIMKREGYY